MLRELHSVGFVIEQEVVADADGFAFRLRNNSERAARGSFTIACRSASVCKLVGAPTGSLAVATTADGREIRIDDDALGAAWCLSWPQPPLSRGITAFGASAAGVRIERAFELLPGRSIEMGLATRWLATPWLAKPAGGLVAAEPTRLAFSGHDQATDGEFEWMFARLARAPLSFMDAVRLGHHAEAEAWLEVRLRTTHGAQAALDCERALALIAWTGTARQPKVLWPGLCRILAQWIAIGADATDGRTWRAAALVARAMGDGGLARICTANAKCSSRTPVPECSDELDLVTAYPRGSPADAAQQSFSAIVGHVIGARVALERMEVELAPSPTRWPRFAFAGLVLQGHQIAGELEWSDDQCSLKMTLLATPLAATTEPATTQPLELELAPHLLASKELGDGDFARVTSDGMPIECRSEPDETGFRARVRCRILGAIELSFTSRAETRAPLA